MASRLNPYLNFNGNTRQAMEFYQGVFGGSLAITTFAEIGMGDSADADRVAHAQLDTDAGYTIMAADLPGTMEYRPMEGCSVSLNGDDDALLRGYWEKLSASGTTTMPLSKQVWGAEFGMCTDGFGVPWQVNIAPWQG